jgi:N-acetylglucosamine kinase-like BadF-type ATPase
MTQWVIGVDGGQTTTRCVIADTTGRVLGHGRGGGLIHLAAEGGTERFLAVLSETLAEAWQTARLAPQAVSAIALGLTGVNAGSHEAEIVARLLPQCIQTERVEIQNDGVAALYGAHCGGPGIVVIAGTGTITQGMAEPGRIETVGGWGWLLGDEGSACSIGRDGLIAAFAAYDGIGQSTVMVERFEQRFAVPSLSDVKRIVYAPGFGAAGFAALAIVVSDAASQGDGVAQAIIERAGAALARGAAALAQRLPFKVASVPVAPVGGAFEHVHGLQTAFASRLRAEAMNTLVVDAALPPVLGAVLMALARCGESVEAALPALKLAAAY